MGSNRNLPCSCGSGKKYKKCCLNSNNVTNDVISNQLKQRLDKPCWYHGTDGKFQSWEFPPPRKPGQEPLVPHTAIFFSTNYEFASGAGKNIAKVALSSRCKILDATENYAASERLRLEVQKNQIAARSLNIQHDYWHQGWLSGDVLRMAYTDAELDNHLSQMALDHSNHLKVPLEVAATIVQHNTTRGLIELICVSAKGLGFDVLFGHEVDRHTVKGLVVAQPWLAVFSQGAISAPEWTEV